MTTRLFLAVVGLMYLGLAAWCSLDPSTTSEKVGFNLIGGSGQSEFLVIYGGLECALAVTFLLPLFKPSFGPGSLLVCTIVHACLVLFRSISLFVFDSIEKMTYQLAVGEWIIFAGCLACLFVDRQSKNKQAAISG